MFAIVKSSLVTVVSFDISYQRSRIAEYQSVEDEDEALAIAIKLSRIEYENSQSVSVFSQQ